MKFFAFILAAVNYSQSYEGSVRDGKVSFAEDVVDDFVASH